MSRSAAETERIYGPWEYRAWGYGLACLVVGCKTRDCRPGGTHWMECCHSTNGGMQRKADWMGNTFFACWRHHDESGQVGVLTFAKRHVLAVQGVVVSSLKEAARVTLERYEHRVQGLVE